VALGPYRLYVDPAGREGGEPSGDRFRLLERLLELDEVLTAARGDALERSLECLMEVLGARRGVVFAADASGGLAPTCERPAGDGAALSRRVLERLARLDRPALVADVDEDPLTRDVASLASGVASIVAAPLSDGARRLGLLYLESPARGVTFPPGTVRFLERFAAHAARLLGAAAERGRLAALTARLGAAQGLLLGGGREGPAIVGTSAAMRELRARIDDVAASDATTLVTGESGTGKELVARALHVRSRRAAGPFVPVHCMALAEDLVEPELFGHVRGAFSGASADRVGRLELAQGGTLFLDEVGELSPRIQVKLLRVLQEKRYERVGESTARELDARIVAATNADLAALVADGRFRADLFYRIKVVELHVPPLRERLEDLPALAAHLVEELDRSLHRTIKGLAPEALERLATHDWPGNVRELRNVLEHAFVRERGEWLTPASLPLAPAAAPVAVSPGADGPWPANLEEAKRLFERRFIMEQLRRHGGNLAATAKALGTSRQNLYRKVGDELGTRPRS
jgi:transcriptional regulator with GAF, ATPase, and Fis domain